jgi:hypothetical protein
VRLEDRRQAEKVLACAAEIGIRQAAPIPPLTVSIWADRPVPFWARNPVGGKAENAITR